MIAEPWLTVCALIGVLLALLVAPYILWPLIGNRRSFQNAEPLASDDWSES